jgi:hypothetical protein
MISRNYLKAGRRSEKILESNIRMCKWMGPDTRYRPIPKHHISSVNGIKYVLRIVQKPNTRDTQHRDTTANYHHSQHFWRHNQQATPCLHLLITRFNQKMPNPHIYYTQLQRCKREQESDSKTDKVRSIGIRLSHNRGPSTLALGTIFFVSMCCLPEEVHVQRTIP